MLVDLKVVQLLASRLCHDLVGPSSAVNTGLELLAESAEGPFGADGAGGALDLVNRSAGQLGRRLAFFRMAFGQGGGAGSTSSLGEARNLAGDFLAEGKINLVWPDDGSEANGGAVPADWSKLLLNMVLFGAEALPRGGTLTVHVADLPDGLGVALVAAGQGARIRDDIKAVIQPDAPAESLTARNVHGHFAACLAESLNTELEIHEGEANEVRLAILIPRSSEAK